MNQELRIKNKHKAKSFIHYLQFIVYESRGFTLIELLTVAVVLVIVSVLLTIVLTFVLRGNNKINTIGEVRQNGNYAILQISKMIGYAKNFDGVSMDGQTYIANCVQIIPSPPSPTPIPLRYSYVKVSNFDGQNTVFSCSQINNVETIASNGASLIDTDSVSFDANSCWFTCSQKRITDVPTIGINFAIRKNTTSAFFEGNAFIPFQTSITVRNLEK